MPEKTTDEFESFIYEGGDHNPLTLEGSLTRAAGLFLRTGRQLSTSLPHLPDPNHWSHALR